MKEMGPKPELEKGMYKHFKGGEYEVIDLACDTDELRWFVIYESQERRKLGLPSLWLRRYEDFTETVERDGIAFPRFKKIDNTIN